MPLTAFADSVSSNAILAGGRSNAARTIGAGAISCLYDRLVALARLIRMRQCSRVGTRPNLPKTDDSGVSSRSINVCSKESAYRRALREKAVPRGSRTASSFSSIVSPREARAGTPHRSPTFSAARTSSQECFDGISPFLIDGNCCGSRPRNPSSGRLEP
jgi:hypothetical protein